MHYICLMVPLEKQVSYTAVNSYSTLNKLTTATKNVWIVFHGIGFLSRYFINFFNELPLEENYIIAPQAPSKYYLNNEFKHVGASWLTRENLADGIENALTYIDRVYISENVPTRCKLIVFGFSQGVSMATRWVARYKINCSQLVLYAGGIPNELLSKDVTFLKENKTLIKIILGDKDPYLTPDRLKQERNKAATLFSAHVQEIIFEGAHEIKRELINQLV